MNDSSVSSTESRSTRHSRLSADDWAQAALDLIAEQGVGAVAVEPLARRLGVTKGSFYWHFPSRDALLQAALERWEVVEQQQVFGSLEEVPDPRTRLRALFQLVAHEVTPHVIYSELLNRCLAFSNGAQSISNEGSLNVFNSQIRTGNGIQGYLR